MNKWNRARIGKQYQFSASHQLTGFGPNHQCARLHGHNYLVEVEVRGDVSPQTGVICDFAFIDSVMKPIIKSLDHYHLNDLMDNPTAENLAQWIMDQASVKMFYSVTVWETPKCWAKVVNVDGFYRADEKDD